jgi:pyridoxal phosphate enzyme (YggS family)
LGELKENYIKIQNAILEARKKSKEQKEVRLLAVSKKQSLEKIKTLFELGQKEFAENYLQELKIKAKILRGPSWVFIGRLQSNKIKEVVRLCSEIQSVASFEHARRIATAAREFKKTPYPVYLLVNLGEEDSKDGVLLSDAEGFAKKLEENFPELKIQGLMSIPPRVDFSLEQEESPNKMYNELYEKAKLVGKGKLSLGMSEDLEQAILAGSDCVRIGTALFGIRK